MKSRITLARELAGLSQRDLAARMGISASTLNGYEKGNHDPKSVGLISIAQICGVTVDYLLSLTDSPKGSRSRESLPPSDQSLLDAYHRAPQETKDIVDVALRPYRQPQLEERAI